MQVARLKAEGEAPACAVQQHALAFHRPLAAQAPLVRSKLGRRLVDLRAISDDPARRRKTARTFVAQIALVRQRRRGARCRFDTLPLGRHEARRNLRPARLGQQLLDHLLRLVVLVLAELVVADAPLRVDEIERGPVLVVEPAPDREVAVDGDREVDLQILDRPVNVGRTLLERELRRVHADHDEARVLCTSRTRPAGKAACAGS